MNNQTLQQIHDLLDDANAEHATRDMLCLFCEASTFNAHVGIVHAAACVIQRLRDRLKIW
jgi:hypothetical protein